MVSVSRKDVASVIHASSEGIVIDIEVSPGAKFVKLSSINQWRKRLELSVKAKPKKGEANKEVAKFLSGLFGVPSNNVTILAGATSSQKRVQVTGVTMEKATEIIFNALSKGDAGGPK